MRRAVGFGKTYLTRFARLSIRSAVARGASTERGEDEVVNLDPLVAKFHNAGVKSEDGMSDRHGSGPGPITRVRVPKTSEIVADHFRSQIVRGDLQEGDYLPPEGQLMASLGISRPTLREAFRILEAESLISVVRGSRTGARVHKPSVELVSRYAGYVLESQGTTMADLYEARLAIEPHVVRRLATKQGMRTLREEAINLVSQDVTTISEVIRSIYAL